MAESIAVNVWEVNVAKSGHDRRRAAPTTLPKDVVAQQVPNAASPALMRASDVAALIGSTEAQVRNMRARAQLPPPIKVPGLGVRWLRTDIQNWLTQLAEQR